MKPGVARHMEQRHNNDNDNDNNIISNILESLLRSKSWLHIHEVSKESFWCTHLLSFIHPLTTGARSLCGHSCIRCQMPSHLTLQVRSVTSRPDLTIVAPPMYNMYNHPKKDSEASSKKDQILGIFRKRPKPLVP